MKQAWIVPVALAVLGAVAAPDADRIADWNRVRDALSRRLPQTALEALDPVLRRAEDEHADGEATRALLLKVALESAIQGNHPEEKITRLTAAVAGAPATRRPVLEAVLARWYWQYFESNRWRILQRTRTAETPDSDFTTWDLPRLYAEIDRHYGLALAGAPVLQRLPIERFASVFTGGNAPDSYRPTVYDAVAHMAREFWASGEQAGAHPEDSFVLRADSPALAPAEEFIRWTIDVPDTASPVVRALRLDQRLLRFHRRDRDPAALVDADLLRIEFAHEHAVGPGRDARYVALLEDLAARYASHEISTRALGRLAELRRSQGRLVDAHRIATLGWSRFPGSVGGAVCFNVLRDLESKALGVSVSDDVWNRPAPTIEISYRNLREVHFRLVPVDFDSLLSRTVEVFEWPSGDLLNSLPQRPPVREWRVRLAGTPDFRARVRHVAAPLDVPPGAYWLLASARADFGTNDNQMAATGVWVSGLALIVRNGRPSGLEGFVLDAATGAPVAGADVNAWQWRRPGTGRLPGPFTRTDADGRFQFPRAFEFAALTASRGAQRVGTCTRLPSDESWPEPAAESTLLFTDRVIYRPGQTVHYKGLCVRSDPRHDVYATIAGRAVHVAMVDDNDRVVAEADHTTSEHGSFSGTFTADANGLLGVRRLEMRTGPPGSCDVRVEEYRRPRFTVALDAPVSPPVLAGLVRVPGRATAYTGAPVDGARVAWRVVREVRYPDWWGWRWGWRGTRFGGDSEIAHGTATTDAEGHFEVAFAAKPDSTVAPEEEPVFTYTLVADVTDANGETRSAGRHVPIGYAALAASLDVDPWPLEDADVHVRLRTTALDGSPRAGGGVVEVLRLRGPAVLSRAPVDDDVPAGDTRAREKAPAPDPARIDTWETGGTAFRRRVTTDSLGETRVTLRLAAGAYRVRFTGRDGAGHAVRAFAPLQVLDLEARRSATPVVDFFRERSHSVEPGGEWVAVWGTGFPRAHAYVEVECGGRMLQAYWIPDGATQHVLRQKVDPSMRGGFTVRVTRVCENRAYLQERTVDVPWSDRVLHVTWDRFTSKLVPGGIETWTANVRGPGGGPAGAEMVATLYDASLDALAPFRWPGRIQSFRINHDQRGPSLREGPTSLRTFLASWPHEWRDAWLAYRSIPEGLLDGDFTFGMAQLPAPAMPDRNRGSDDPDHGRILGRLCDARGEPIAYANVSLASVRKGALTDEDGRFSISGIPPGFLTLTASPVGYERVVQQIRVARGETVNLELRAARAYRANLEEITVRASRRISTAATATKPTFAVDNLTEGITAEAGAVAMGGELHFRGGRGDEVQVTSGGALAEVRRDLSQVTARRDLRETAFFFPVLRTDSSGAVRMEFTVPQGLGEWRFSGFAHDDDLRTGVLSGHAVTALDLMVQPNPPRFLREGDELEFPVKLVNRTDTTQVARVRLTWTDAVDQRSVTLALGVRDSERTVEVPPRQSRTCGWRLQVPDGPGVLAYRVVAATAGGSDGEEGEVPVLSRAILVTESLPLPIRGAGRHAFDFERLRHSGDSPTLRSRTLTLQVVSNPAWYAVMALPYLIEFPHECSEQTFNRLYANALARHIATSNPRIRKVFDGWRDTPALDSPLDRNADLRSVALAEMPWLRQAEAESRARRNVGVLFDAGRLDEESDRALRRLEQMQLADGAWPWFPGGLASDYLTLYITTGFGRLRHLGVHVPMDPAYRSLARLDDWCHGEYRRAVSSAHPEANHLTPTIALWLYMRSFFLDVRPIAPERRAAVDYWLGQAKTWWVALGERQSLGQLALGCLRFGDTTTARAIVGSLREFAVHDRELGMFWRDTERSWWWWRAPIETQAVMIEAFDEVAHDSIAVEDCKVWLLKQKQTQDWKTTKATADAVYALLLRGTDLLASRAVVAVTLGDSLVRPGGVEAGTGFYEERWRGPAIRPAVGTIEVRKSDPGVAWGSLHWQYLEDMDRVTPWTGTPLQLTKSIFVRSNGKSGPELHAPGGPLHVGDELVVRIELRTDRDMEYVHLKDLRGSGVEPTNVLSGYRYQDGLRYYEVTRDAASHFFIDYLPKGTYVFEYPVRVEHRGRFTSGIAEIECAYAPEFGSHSAAVPLVVE